MKPLLSLALVASSLFSYAAFAEHFTEQQRTTAKALSEQALSSSLAYDIVESLTTEVGPRMAATEGDAKAVAWATAKLKSLGFDKVWTEPVAYPTWIRGEESAQITAPYPQPLMVTALGYSVATPKKGLEAQVVAFDNLEQLEQAEPATVANKIVFINYRIDRSKDGSGYGPGSKIRGKAPSVAGQKGAAAVVIRSVSTASDRFPHTGVTRYQDGIKKIPAAAISNSDADLLANMLKRGQPVTLKLKLDTKTTKPYTSYNVIGEFTGRDTPEQYVLLGAHLDSWDLGTGALDDGAGVGIVSAAAALIGKLPERPRKSVRVVLFANEEQGLLGAAQYAEANKATLNNIVVAAESDFGAGRIYTVDSKVADDKVAKAVALVAEMAHLNVTFGNNQAHGGPDTIPLRKIANVPVFSLNQDGTDYFDYHHTPNDTLDKIDPEQLAQNVAVWVMFAYLSADQQGDFGKNIE